MARGDAFDLSGGFSATNNPNGPWAYGWEGTLGGTFTALTVPHISTADGGVLVPSWQLTSFQTPAVYKNTSGHAITVAGGRGSLSDGAVWFIPGENGRPENFGVIRFTAPSNGAYRVETAVAPAYSDSSLLADSDFHVLRNGEELFGRFLAPGESASFAETVLLTAGDIIDFAMGRGADGSQLNSVLQIRATLTPAPAPPQPPPSGNFDLSGGFSATNNPNGPWAYGWEGTLGGAFTALTVPHISTADGGVLVPSWQLTSFQTPAVYKNTSGQMITIAGGRGSLVDGAVWFHPGENGRPENFGVIRFTAPSNGAYRVEAAVAPLYSAASLQADADFHVLRNGEELFGRFLAPGESASFAETVLLTAGDVIDFAIGRGADGNQVNTGLQIRATLTPAPAPPQPPPSGNFDLSGGFSAVNNPNGPWAYGWEGILGGAFTALAVPHISTADGGVLVPSWQFTSFQTPAVYKNTSGQTISVGGGQASYPDGTVWYFPGENGRPENFGVIRFTAPSNGAYRVETAVAPVYPNGPPQGDTDFHVLKNGVEIFGRFLAPSQSATFSETVVLASGGTIDFAIGRGADGNQYGSGLQIRATLTPAPGSPQPPDCVSPASGLVAWWPLNGDAQDAVDGNTGALSGHPVFDGGKVGQGLRFDGADDHIRVPASTGLDVGAGAGLTIELWLNPQDVNSPMALLEWSTTVGPQPGLHFYTFPSGSLFANLIDTDVVAHHFSSPSGVLTAGVFQHVAFTYDRASGVGRFYVNGVKVAENTIGSLRVDTRPDLWIGQRFLNGPDYLFRGTMDEISLYNRALSAAEIQAIHQAGAAGKCPRPPRANHAPIAKAEIRPIFEVWPEETSFLVIAANGVEAELTLDGSQSSDADNDALDYLWIEGGQASPFATGVRVANSFGLGEYVVTLIVSDGQDTGHDTVTFEVITLSDAVNELILLLTETDLDRRNKRPLLVTLNAAWESFEDGDLEAGVKRLRVFQQKVRAQVSRDNPDAADRLIRVAQQIIEAVDALPPGDPKSKGSHRGK